MLKRCKTHDPYALGLSFEQDFSERFNFDAPIDVKLIHYKFGNKKISLKFIAKTFDPGRCVQCIAMVRNVFLYLTDLDSRYFAHVKTRFEYW
jgi:hypothetical protein